MLMINIILIFYNSHYENDSHKNFKLCGNEEMLINDYCYHVSQEIYNLEDSIHYCYIRNQTLLNIELDLNLLNVFNEIAYPNRLWVGLMKSNNHWIPINFNNSLPQEAAVITYYGLNIQNTLKPSRCICQSDPTNRDESGE